MRALKKYAYSVAKRRNLYYNFTVKYNVQRDNDNLEVLDRYIKKLPPFCSQFFMGIAQTKSVLTRLNYAVDLYIFFSFLTTEAEHFAAKSINDISVTDLNEIKIGDIEMYLSYLSHYKLNGKEHINGEQGKMRKCASLRSFFKYFYRREEINENVMTKVDMPKVHEKEIIRLNDGEVQKMLELSAGSQRDNMIITLFLLSGIRVSELVGLDYGDINLGEGAFVVTRKGGKRTILYMGAQLRDKFADYFANCFKEEPKKETPIFQKCGRRITTRAVCDIIHKYAGIAAPLKKISPHKLRTTFGTNLYRATGDIYTVATVLGHSNVDITKKHYAAITDDIIKNASNAVKI
jgi:site-specific recombinase XerD